MTPPVWRQRRLAQQPAEVAARIEWLLHRHHCHDPIGGPLPRDLLKKKEPEHG